LTPKRKALIALGCAIPVLGGVLFAVTRGEDDSPSTTTTTPAVTTTTVPPVLWPLTGVPAEPDAPVDRPALAVKISNSSTARPQVGLERADLVFEERVEGITRFIAVFHSTSADPVGPVRSARDSDIDLLAALGRPVFVWGGANEGVAARVAGANVVSFNVDPDAAEDKFRDENRTAPDNLFINSTDAFWAKAGDASPAVAPLPVPRRVRRANAPVPGTPTPGVTVDYGGTTASFVWDGSREGWARVQDGTPHLVADGTVLAPTNVVLLVTPYGTAPSDPASPIALTTGSGDATVLIGGNAVDATWSRPTPSDPYTLTDDATGRPLVLAAGRTWVGLPDAGVVRLDQAAADSVLAQLPAAG
jgi:Protein of unknown function (DUF3048) N-terminal domain/Protein of unknown function (DUF3048) C-terminal domain